MKFIHQARAAFERAAARGADKDMTDFQPFKWTKGDAGGIELVSKKKKKNPLDRKERRHHKRDLIISNYDEVAFFSRIVSRIHQG